MNTILRAALYQILKSLMRILYRKGVAFGEFTQLAKQAYVDVVEDELTSSGERATTTRIAVITGLTRKEVTQLRQAEITEVAPRFNRVLRVLNGWLHDANFLDREGQPAVLAFRGAEPSFEQLVQRYSGDMSSFAMLDEMKRVQLVDTVDEGAVRLLSATYIPDTDDEAQLQLLGSDVSLLVMTINHNLIVPSDERYYQRKVSYNNLPQEVLPAFRSFVRKDAHQLLLRFNQWLYQHDRDHSPEIQGTGRMQAGVGIYYFEQPMASKETSHED
ncbi:hypothetical protein SAMN02745130_03734 [Thiothrix eikelboomii]|uniref:Uncharacterized protein n=1 Tax=Thiothrix eikelboomii TaxID=92487 RepID=A0A1T4Y0A8_9GAMM|nr:DUF6502 family protein [Thiothrix eikelboomii]SKA95232.1 hypothetical protein SAMN02745130_03734 [Thiothrix eikelboomii]